jgi:hypothetical protein
MGHSLRYDYLGSRAALRENGWLLIHMDGHADEGPREATRPSLKAAEDTATDMAQAD